MFRVGQKVVCVKEGRGKKWADHNSIVNAVVGQTYTIRAAFLSLEGEEAVYVEEIKNKEHRSGMEFGFCAYRFRPVVERKTDISIFKAMLTPAGKKERV
jgi:hypothetical protein